MATGRLRTTIAYVENNPDDIFLLQCAFRKLDENIFVCGLRSLSELQLYLGSLDPAAIPALFMVDLRLDGESGLDALRLVKQNAMVRHVPVIMFSGGGFPVDVKEAQARGAMAYVVKPFGFGALINILGTVTQSLQQPPGGMELWPEL